MSYRVLLVTAVVLEAAGIILIAVPDLVPYGERFSRWVRKHTDALADRVRRLIGRPRPIEFTPASATMTMGVGRPTLIHSKSADAPLDEKVEFLLERDRTVQREMGEVRARFDDVQAVWAERLADARQEIEARFARALNAAEAKYRPLRVVGVLMLLAGLAFATLAGWRSA